MASRYAEGTTTSVDSSIAELKRILGKHGTDQASFGWADEQTEVVGFRFRERFYRFEVPHPPPGVRNWQGRVVAPAKETMAPRDRRLVDKYQRSQRGWDEVCQREVMRRWRVLVLLVKSRFEIIESDVEDPDVAFMAYALLPDGSTLGEHLRPQIEEMYRTGRPPRLTLTVASQPAALPERTESDGG